MCVIIYNPPKVIINRETFVKCARANSDGMGLAIPLDGKIKIVKSLDDVDKFYDQYKELRINNPLAKIGIHFRLSTQGEVSVKNSHPFRIKRDVAFFHNGIISGMGFEGTKSDTMIFNDRILKKLPKGFYKNKTILKMLCEYIGGYNKLLFLDKEGYAMIIGVHKGEYDKEGNWFSNMNWNYTPYNYDRTTYERDGWVPTRHGMVYREQKKIGYRYGENRNFND